MGSLQPVESPPELPGENSSLCEDSSLRNDQNCKVRGLRKHYDPARLQLEALEEAKAKEIAEAKSELTAAAFLCVLDSLALTSSTRSPSPHRRFMDDE